MATDGNDTLIGTAASDLLDGLSGDDSLVGLAGLDTLLGGNGRDTLDGGTGADRLVGGVDSDAYRVDDSHDVVIEDQGDYGTDTIYTSVTYSLPLNIEFGLISGDQDVGIYGNTQDNTLTGGDGRNKLWAGAGNDTVNGGNGNDDLSGGLGNDLLVGGDGKDLFRPGLGQDQVDGWDTRQDYPWDTLFVDYGSLRDPVQVFAGAGIVLGGLNSIEFTSVEMFSVTVKTRLISHPLLEQGRLV